MKDSTDQVLLRALRRGDDEAARCFYSRVAPALAPYARTLLRDQSLADDAVQSALCRIFQLSEREIDRVQNPKAWLAQIVRREALTMIRTNRRMHARNLAHARLNHRELSDERDRGFDVGESVERAVALLPRRLQEVVVLRHVGGLSFDDIAQALRANKNTVASRYREGVSKIQGLIARRETARERAHVR